MSTHPVYRTAEELSDGSGKGDSAHVHHEDPNHEHHFQRQHRTPGEMEIGLASVVQDRLDSQRPVVPAAGIGAMEFRTKWEQMRPELGCAIAAEIIGVS